MQGFAIPGETGLDRKLKASRLRLEGDFLEVHGSYRYCGRFTGLCRGLLEGSWVVIKWGSPPLTTPEPPRTLNAEDSCV